MRLKHVKGANEIIEKGKYYVEDATNYIGKWKEVFQNDNPIYIEIGMGKGDFIIENALRYPNINFIGIEKFDSVLVRAIQKSNELEIDNLKLVRLDANYIDTIFSKEISLIYLNFSDPWPKERHAKRRLTSPIFLEKYDKIFKSNAEIIMKTDNNPLFEYSKESLENFGYQIKSITRDLYQEDISQNIKTEYEKKFVKLGVKINRLEAIKQPKSNKKSKKH
ncbi:MAG: tRNA (guanosine(46)-N7)-methyltransferase TrmB [Bacilli bacterium]|nr:tRNA (guanosine(46)-N7)-methyltransferase TrmB [Bacilli bacterium]